MRNFSRLAAPFVIVLAAFALVGCGGDDDEGAAGDETTVELAAVGDSGQTGTATLTADGSRRGS